MKFDNINYKNDAEDLSVLIFECDLVITIHNFTEHINDSLGVKTCVFFPYYYQ